MAIVVLFYLTHLALFRLRGRESFDRLPYPARALAYSALLLVVFFGAVGSSGDFIYYQF